MARYSVAGGKRVVDQFNLVHQTGRLEDVFSGCWKKADQMAQLVQAFSATPRQKSHAAQRFYQPELDGLRFYAFLGVFVYHTLPSQPLFYLRLHLPLPLLWAAISKSGASGVDCFSP